jgi:decaprenylphospho-beta-D-erythro-pentofuranosid-2-ulose 2-reductase
VNVSLIIISILTTLSARAELMTFNIAPSVLILGARSDIARPLARLYAQDGYHIILAARNVDRLGPDAADLQIRFGQSVDLREFDACDTDQHTTFLNSLGELPDTVISLVGLMTPQDEAQAEFGAAKLMIQSNYLGLVSILGKIADRMEMRGSGTIIGVSSVAGDRGRATNYIYGSAKAGFSTFLSGLRKNVTVITIKPGFIRTRMTENLDLPAALTATPDELATVIRRAHKRKKLVVYHRPVWRLIMMIICSLPESLFARTKL